MLRIRRDRMEKCVRSTGGELGSCPRQLFKVSQPINRLYRLRKHNDPDCHCIYTNRTDHSGSKPLSGEGTKLCTCFCVYRKEFIKELA